MIYLLTRRNYKNKRPKDGWPKAAVGSFGRLRTGCEELKKWESIKLGLNKKGNYEQ